MRTAATARYRRNRRGSAVWRAITWVLLLSFTLQSYITETHIHGVAFSTGGASIVKIINKAPANDQAPTDRDSSSCPFCQAIASAGLFFTPAAPVLLLPSQTAVIAAPLGLAGVAYRAFAQGWRSRAHPQH